MKIKSLAMAAFLFCSVVMAGAETKTALSLYNKAYQFQQREDFYSAIESYREALQINPQYGDAWYNLALCTFHLGEYDLAVTYADSAAKYSRNLSEIQNLKGMALISMGRIDEARTVFEAVLKKYPNDVNARFGLAEIDLYKGSATSAEKKYLDALKRDNTNRKALLSLALVSADQGNNAAAERYVNQALEYHSGEAEVHYLASYLAAKRGELKEAERRARSAVQIKGDYDKAYELLADILFSQGRYDEVIDICEFRIGRNRNLPVAWYLKGISLEKLGRSEEAIDTLNKGLQIDPLDELMRLALEQIVNNSLAIEDSRRAQWAQFHAAKALEFNRAFDGPSERYEYQKALSMDPLNIKTRQAFANLLERDGFHELYLQQLKFIRANETRGRDRTVQQKRNDDTIEGLESLLRSNLAARYSIDPFYLDKSRWNIGVYFEKAPVQLLHSDAEEVVANAVRDLFNGVAVTTVDVKSEGISGFAEAYRMARTSGRDYFIIISVDETDRSFTLDASMYSARTGTKTTDIKVYRTGNDRIAKSIRRLRQAVLDILPIRGTVLYNSTNTVLVDLGKSDGITKGAQFDVVKKGKVVTADSGPGVYYSESDIIGTFTVTTVNEEISEGTYQKKGFYDTLNVGDELILVKLSDTNSAAGNAVTDTRPAADKEGNPATSSAAKAERESIKEDLKAPQRNSTLIQMIHSLF
ncbi:MAG TPA: hypothetical protein DEO40_07070 [Treponema sp.]|nr:hypothetical protein [Treponema sp.]